MANVNGTEEGAKSGALELVDLSKVRAKLEELVGGGHLDHGVMLLEQVSRWPDSTRYLSDNLWLYGKIGDLNRAIERDEDAMKAYARGFEIDPRNLGILKPYSELLFHHHRSEDGLKVVQAMLLHHKRSLGKSEIIAIYRQLGSFYEGLGQLEKAQASFEKALDQDPDDTMSLAGLLRVVAASGEPLDIVRVRQKLIRALKDPVARSHALVALGDDWAEQFNDPGRALDVYEQAIQEHRENKTAVERLARVGAEIGDWRRVSRAYFTLSQLAKEPKEQAEWIIRSSQVARDEMWEADKALAGFKRALELDPTRLDAFRAVTSILVDGKDWEGLEAAYLQLISANVESGAPEIGLLVVLWQKLGELYRTHLQRPVDAIFAYEQASTLQGGNVDLHLTIAEIAENTPDQLGAAVTHLRAVYDMDRSRLDVLDRLGRDLLRMKDADSAWCVFRALKARGFKLDEKASQFVDRFNTSLFRPISRPFTPDILNNHVFSRELDAGITEVFRVLKPALEEWTGEATSKWGLKKNNRVSLDQPLAFNRIYKSIGGTLGYRTLPELWHKADQVGIVNGALLPEGMIAGDDILGSGREEYTAFIVGKQLFLFLAPFYLAAIRPISDLQVFLILAAAAVRPDVQIELSKDMDAVLNKHIKKKVKGPQFDQLKAAIDKVSRQQADVGKWLEAVEDTANRVGLIFCDDLDSAREYLSKEPQPLGSRTVDQKMQALIEYSISPEYLALREKLGVKLG